jgi:hypothetical protein
MGGDVMPWRCCLNGGEMAGIPAASFTRVVHYQLLVVMAGAGLRPWHARRNKADVTLVRSSTTMDTSKAIIAIIRTNEFPNLVEVKTCFRVKVVSGHEPGCERRPAALFSRK